jgi:hypothetical protein
LEKFGFFRSMRLHVADPTRALDQSVDVAPGTTIQDLKQIVASAFHYDTENCLIFSDGHSWTDGEAVSVPDDTLFVFFNTKVFSEKSYPSVDGAFPFPTSRFGRPRNQMDDFGLGLEVALWADSDTETSDEDEEIEIRRHRLGRWEAARLRDDLGRAMDDEIAFLDPAVRVPRLPGGRLAVHALRRGFAHVQIDEFVHNAIQAHRDGLGEESDSEEEEPERIQVGLEGVPIQMTPDEEAAVMRLHGMVPRFDVDTVVQVYFACDKDEVATHQCLLSMP